MMEHDVDACHSEDFFWSAQGVVEEDFYTWLIRENPDIWLGELRGKHSNVYVKFNALVVEKMDDYFRVEAKKDHMPDCLKCFHDLWKREAEEDEAWADKEFGKESPKKRARTEKHEEGSAEKQESP
jgi:hypothetical protein